MESSPQDPRDLPPSRPAGAFVRFAHWLRGIFFRKKRGGGSGTPPNIYPLY